jgi:hypothetical protein
MGSLSFIREWPRLLKTHGVVTESYLVLGTWSPEGLQVCPEDPMFRESAVRLLSGDALLPVAVALAVILLLVDLMHQRQRCPLPTRPCATAWAGQPAARGLPEHAGVLPKGKGVGGG